MVECGKGGLGAAVEMGAATCVGCYLRVDERLHGGALAVDGAAGEVRWRPGSVGGVGGWMWEEERLGLRED